MEGGAHQQGLTTSHPNLSEPESPLWSQVYLDLVEDLKT